MSEIGQLWDRYYAENSNGYGSGEGSITPSTTDYRFFIENFIRLNRVKRVLELGCGDWQVGRLIPWDDYGVTYCGTDISPFIVEQNSKLFGSPTRKFHVINGAADLAKFGTFDLILCKHVLQHLANAVVSSYLDAFERLAPWSLVTNDAYPLEHVNLDVDVPVDGYRPLDIRGAPFNRRAVSLCEFTVVLDDKTWVTHIQLMNGRP